MSSEPAAKRLKPNEDEFTPVSSIPEHWKQVPRHGKVLAGTQIVAFKAPFPEGALDDEEYEFTPWMLTEYYDNKNVKLGCARGWGGQAG